MLRRLRPRLTFANVTALTALFFALGGSVVLAHGGDAAKIHGCVDESTGALTILADSTGFGDPSATCPPGNGTVHALDWNVTGPPGPAGPAGPDGPKGDGAPPSPPAPPTPPKPPEDTPPPPRRDFARLTRHTVVLRQVRTEQSFDEGKAESVTCPGNYPKLLEGGASATFLYNVAGFAVELPYPVLWVYNHAAGEGWVGWAVADPVRKPEYVDQSWRLTVWAKCARSDKAGLTLPSHPTGLTIRSHP